jgi:hypothetical protein
VTITLTANAPAYSVTLSVLNATTTDERCVTLSGVDLGCVIGDLPTGASTTVVVTGAVGQVECRAFAFTNPDLTLNSYRSNACKGD